MTKSRMAVWVLGVAGVIALSGCATTREASEARALPDADSPRLTGEPLPDTDVGPDVALAGGAPLASPQRTVVERALQLLGIRYRYGGGDPQQGFDCSGFVRYVFRELPVPSLPHASLAMSRLDGPRVDRDALAPGDLLFFKIRRNVVSHVAIYLGEGQFIHAPSSGGKVRVERLDQPYWSKRYASALRILPTVSPAPAATLTTAAQ